MDAIKRAGIWMDYSVAHIMEYTGEGVERQRIESRLVPKSKTADKPAIPSVAHFREKRKLIGFYKKISNAVARFDMVVLFGPTKAKNQLLHLLNNDKQFDEIRIDIRQAGKMTDYQLKDYVNTYFSATAAI